jgi:uncharacterized protein with von Willebrand factor type A (vWA) domain
MNPADAVRHDADEVLGAFALALRTGGIVVTQDRTQSFLVAVSEVGMADLRAVYWAGRATLCASPDDTERYDTIFTAWFSDQPPSPVRPVPTSQRVTPAALDVDGESGDGAPELVVQVSASERETLRHRDVADLSAAERAELAGVFRALRPRVPVRRSLRHRSARHGDIDGPRTLRDQLRHGGEPARLRFRDHAERPRRVVLLVDVSGSMEAYADSHLRWAHLVARANPGRTEVFTIGTRLTRITKAMGSRDPETALQAAGDTVPDWSGGTRLGEVLGAFLERWGQRGLARRAVVVIISDGWERGDPQRLAEQMERLHRLAHRVVWVNPHRGKEGYQPVQSGMAAALPFVDDFVAGHSLATFEEALEVIGRA